MNRVVIIDTGIANTASVRACFTRLACDVMVTDDPAAVRDAEFVVVPGVGRFGAGMRALQSRGFDRAIVERYEQGLPLLGICLGLQLLCTSSTESEGVAGLGLIDASVTEFPCEVRTPQHGWNRVGDGYAYYSNSYRIESIPAGWSGELSDHGGPFVAYLQRGATLACQFHPELSGAWGERLLASWLKRSQEVSGC